MKINTQLNFPFSQKFSQVPKNTMNFAAWIQSPTKQTNGDEYYWQHQEHLQKSAIKFEKNFIKAKRRDIYITNNSLQNLEMQEKTQKGIDAVKQCKENNTYKTLNFSSKNYNNSAYLVSNDKKTLPVILPYAANNRLMQNKEIKNTLKSKITCNLYSLPSFKNFHLFIKNYQAEFSFNKLNMNKNEEKKFIQAIKNFLKNHGIILSQLIINGVKK